MKKLVLLVVLFSSFLSCKTEESTAQEIVDNAIKVAGGEGYAKFDLELDFRDRHYRIMRDQGNYQFERHFKDSINQVKDIVTNSGFQRYINGSLIKVADSMAFKYTNSINSVQYFALLPFGLNDPAVNKKYLGKETINASEYHKVEVTFLQEGGGKDYEDVFIYWLNTETYKLDYLAYSYVTDGGGMRFREAYNERYVGDLRLLDYNNYKSEDKSASLQDLGRLFEEGQLKLLSKIENTNLKMN